MYRIIWNTDYGVEGPVVSYSGHRNSPVPNPADQRPTSVDADRYEIIGLADNVYMPQITFYQEERQVMTLFTLPLAIEDVAIIS